MSRRRWGPGAPCFAAPELTTGGCRMPPRTGPPRTSVQARTRTMWVLIVDETADEKSSADCAGAARQ